MRHATLTILLALSAIAAGKPARTHALRTTETARQLVLGRIDEIARVGACRQSFARQNIDLDRLRLTLPKVRFYNAVGPEGELRFSDAVGAQATPDQTLRALAQGLPADAFVLGYQDGRRYVRTRHVVLTQTYFAHDDSGRQSLLLHELLHIVLDTDDTDLNRRDLCPLRLLSFCRDTESSASAR